MIAVANALLYPSAYIVPSCQFGNSQHILLRYMSANLTISNRMDAEVSWTRTSAYVAAKRRLTPVARSKTFLGNVYVTAQSADLAVPEGPSPDSVGG